MKNVLLYSMHCPVFEALQKYLGALISGLASSVFAVLDALSTVFEVLQRYLMCTKHQLGDNLGDDSPAHYLLTCTFNRILRIVLNTSLVTLFIAIIFK